MNAAIWTLPPEGQGGRLTFVADQRTGSPWAPVLRGWMFGLGRPFRARLHELGAPEGWIKLRDFGPIESPTARRT